MPRIAEPRPGEPITLEFLKDGTPRYRAVVDVGTARQRKQQKRRFRTITEARAWLDEVRTDSRRGTYVAPSDRTFNDLADAYLRLADNRVRAVSVNGYTQSLQYAKDAFGTLPAQEISRDDVLALVDSMAAQGLAIRTVRGTLVHLQACFELAIEDRVVLSNPARKIKARGRLPGEKAAHTETERTAHIRAAQDEWLSACWLLSMAGLRRSEVLGLRWSDLDLDQGSLTVARGRVLVDPKTVAEGAPKSANSARTIALPAHYVSALKEMRARHAQVVGLAHVRSGNLAIDELGRPLRPERYSDHWKRLCKKAGVRVLTLHEARHTSVSLLRAKGIPDQIIAAFHGHDEQTMRRTYSHLQPEDLRRAAEAL
ncbi:MAG: site-specific integrase [Candidatus Nanopelagicales bacterium]